MQTPALRQQLPSRIIVTIPENRNHHPAISVLTS
jgi:hypothetical protein